MESNHVQVYCGNGRGKSNAAIGLCIKEASQGKEVIIVQFLKGSYDEKDLLKRLEPEIRVFRFETTACNYSELSAEEQQAQDSNIRNGLNYVKKLMVTDECDVLLIDELLGLVDNHIIEIGDVTRLLEQKPDDMQVILTGTNMPVELTPFVSDVFEIKPVKVTQDDEK